ncbi:MAG: ATP-binding cassette domain-containing protein [Planctomycetota bacterium]|nr:MAG: ATP-binding cassette domain-containing protein [Planctomycetota bacterium]
MAKDKGEILLEARGIFKSFRTGTSTVDVLMGTNLTVRAGETVSIVGASGVGKSTFLHILGLLDLPQAGTIKFRGEDLTKLEPIELGQIRNKEIGFVFQFYHLLPDLTAMENVLLPAMVAEGHVSWKMKKSEYEKRAKELLEMVSLWERRDHLPSQLSGGERQRIAICRALFNEPKVLLCDEPTGNLDVETSKDLQEVLWKVQETLDMTLVLVTHDETVAARAERRLRMVEQGLIVEESTPQKTAASRAEDTKVPFRLGQFLLHVITFGGYGLIPKKTEEIEPPDPAAKHIGWLLFAFISFALSALIFSWSFAREIPWAQLLWRMAYPLSFLSIGGAFAGAYAVSLKRGGRIPLVVFLAIAVVLPVLAILLSPKSANIPVPPDFIWLFLFPAVVIIVFAIFIYFLWATICLLRMITSIPVTLVWGAVFLIFVGIGALLQPGMFFTGLPSARSMLYSVPVGLYGLLTLVGAIAVFRRKTWGITLASAAFVMYLLGGVLLPGHFNMPGGFLWELLVFPWVLIGLLLSYLKWDYLAALAARPAVAAEDKKGLRP